MADEQDMALDAFTAQVVTRHGSWSKARVYVAAGAATVFVPGPGGSPTVALSRPAVGLAGVAGRWYVDVDEGDGDTDRWEVAGPCGCGSPSKQWNRRVLDAVLAARARATA